MAARTPARQPTRKKTKHLYRTGAKGREQRSFEERYGKVKGKKVYGAVVGKVKRERAAKKKRG